MTNKQDGKVVGEHGEVIGHTEWEDCRHCKGNGRVGHSYGIMDCWYCQGRGGQRVVTWIKKDPAVTQGPGQDEPEKS